MRRACVVATLVVALVTAGGAAFGEDPDGFERVKVKRAWISILVPDDYEVLRQPTRKEAEEYVKNNPDLPFSVDEYLDRQAFDAGVDWDGNGRADRSLFVNVYPDAPPVPSPAQARAFAAEHGSRNITSGRTRVAGRRAVWTEHEFDNTRPDGTVTPKYELLYEFLTQRGRVTLGFGADSDDTVGYREVIDTIVAHVRLLERS